jgi:carbamoyl-phosphate synthase small subunit
MQQAILLLESGQAFYGQGFGVNGTIFAEVVFNTSMTGYTESLTDPSYAGQLLCFSYPLIGNYGATLEWGESGQIFASGVIVSQLENEPSHRSATEFNSTLVSTDKSQVFGSLDSFLKKFKKSGISGIDTRALVKILRDVGTMPAVLKVVDKEDLPKITSLEKGKKVFEELKKQVDNPEEVGFLDWARKVGSKEIKSFVWQKELDPRLNFPGGRLVLNSKFKIQNSKLKAKRVVLIDCGVKENIVRELAKRDFEVVLVPPTSTFEQIIELKPDGILISNGPGDPRDYDYIYKTVARLIKYSLEPENHLPIFGICLGNQLIACAIEAEIYKMKFGNRGSNQPVIHQQTKKAYLTSQNHSYAVRAETLPEGWEVLFSNLNDQTVEGLTHESGQIFSVQFHPEACAGPRDTNFLFDQFEQLIKRKN